MKIFFTELCFAVTVLGSLEGLYTTTRDTGQLAVISNLTRGYADPIGPALASLGWDVPGECTCAAIDQTRKLHYTLASNASSVVNDTQWYLVGVFLEDGTVRSVQQLPSHFSLQNRCEHTLDVDESDRVLVSALSLQHSAIGLKSPQLHLTLIRIFPDTGELTVLANETITGSCRWKACELHASFSTPSSVFHDVTDTLWLQLGTQILGFNSITRTVDRTVTWPTANTLSSSGLILDVRSQTVCTLVRNASSSVPAFSLGCFEAGAAMPTLELRDPVMPAELASVAADSRSLSIALSRGPSIVVVLGSAMPKANETDHERTKASELRFISLDMNGKYLYSNPACTPACPSSLVYEPFVF